MNQLRYGAGISETWSRSARIPSSDALMFTYLWLKSRRTFCYLFLPDMLIVTKVLSQNYPPVTELVYYGERVDKHNTGRCSKPGNTNPYSPYIFRIHFNITPPFNNILLPSGLVSIKLSDRLELAIISYFVSVQAIWRSSQPSLFNLP
jgi:hypothetical protein